MTTVRWGILAALLVAVSAPVMAQLAGKGPVVKDQPIDISSDKLDVLQNEHKAIFTGNVIAVQGTTTMRARQMTVFYTDSSAPEKPAAGGSTAQGIQRIEADGDVVFTTPQETAQGDQAIYEVANDTITLTGPSVVLTRERNVLKGRSLIYNLATGRSLLNAGGADSSTGKPARVRGLFVPKSSGEAGQ